MGTIQRFINSYMVSKRDSASTQARKGSTQITTKAVDTLLKNVSRGGVSIDERLDLMEVADSFDTSRFVKSRDADRLKNTVLSGMETPEAFASLPKKEQARILGAGERELESVGFKMRSRYGHNAEAKALRGNVGESVRALIADVQDDAEKAVGVRFRSPSFDLKTMRLDGQVYGYSLTVNLMTNNKSYFANIVLGREGAVLSRSGGEVRVI